MSRDRQDILPDNSCLYQFDDFPLGYNGVGEVQASIFPLHWAVDIQGIAQPEIWRPSKNKQVDQHKKIESLINWQNPYKSHTAYLAWNSLVQSECVMFSIESHKQWV